MGAGRAADLVDERGGEAGTEHDAAAHALVPSERGCRCVLLLGDGVLQVIADEA